MRSFRGGLLIGGACGVALGLAAGWFAFTAREASPPHVVDEDRPRATAPPPRHAPAPEPAARRRVDTARRSSTADQPAAREPHPSQKTSQAAPIRPDPDPYEDWTARQFIDELRRVAARKQGGRIQHLMEKLREKHPGTRVPLDLTLALVDARASFTYQLALDTFTDAELLSVVHRAANATPEDRLAWALLWSAAGTVNRRGLALDGRVVERLLSSEIPGVRRSGLALTGRVSGSLRPSILRLARSDPDATARVLAFNVLLDLEERAERPPPADVVEVMGRALRTGNVEMRRETAQLVPRLGESGARLALDLLASQAFALGAEEAQPLVETVVRAGLGARLLEQSTTTEGLRALGWAVSSTLDDDMRDRVLPLADSFDEIAAALSEGDLEDLYQNLAYHGFQDTVIRATLDREANGARRALAFDALWNVYADEDVEIPSFVDVAERVAWDASASVELRSAALDALREEPTTVARAFEIERRMLLEHAPPAALRAAIVDTVGNHFDDDEQVRRLPEILALLKTVAANDPSSWVRAVAEESREAWE